VREEKRIVREFYDTFGWQRNEDGSYKDTKLFEDLRPVLHSYQHKTHMRVKAFLSPQGKDFLDAGAGAIAVPEYFEYSAGFKRRVCIDLSERALVEARSKLREEGVYVLGDVTALPFRDDVFDAIVSAHLLYHVPHDEQETALQELIRTMKPGGSCVIIYTWLPVLTCMLREGSPISMIIWERIMKPILRIPDTPPLYFHTHNYRWFKRILAHSDAWEVDIRCWRLVDSIFARILVPNNFLGRLMMKAIFWFETVFPHISARMGRYPMIIIRK